MGAIEDLIAAQVVQMDQMTRAFSNFKKKGPPTLGAIETRQRNLREKWQEVCGRHQEILKLQTAESLKLTLRRCNLALSNKVLLKCRRQEFYYVGPLVLTLISPRGFWAFRRVWAELLAPVTHLSNRPRKSRFCRELRENPCNSAILLYALKRGSPGNLQQNNELIMTRKIQFQNLVTLFHF
ncbi:hypothetical protein TKK_0002869 [Trichogramma kaykai]